MIATAPAAADPAAIAAAIAHLDQHGYCLFAGLMPEDEADALAQHCLELHQRPELRAHIHGARPYETLFGMLNHDERVWACASHPAPVAVARHFLGPQARVAEAASKPTWKDPDLPMQLHVDSAQWFGERVPDACWLINSMWMLTDFTADNGATGVVPMSHHSRRRAPFADLHYGHPSLRAVTGRRGSLFMWHAGMFHTARPNRTDAPRVGLNIAYFPPWFNIYSEGGHQPVWPETFARMPQAMRELLPQKRGRERADIYESP